LFIIQFYAILQNQTMIIASKNGSMVQYAQILSQRYKKHTSERYIGNLQYGKFYYCTDLRKVV